MNSTNRFSELLHLHSEPIDTGLQNHAMLRVFGGMIEVDGEPLRFAAEDYTANGLTAPLDRHGEERNPLAQQACFPLLWDESNHLRPEDALNRADLQTMKRDLPSSILKDVASGQAKVCQLEYNAPFKGLDPRKADESLELDMFLFAIMHQVEPKVHVNPDESGTVLAIGTVGGLNDELFQWALVIPRKKNADGTYNILLIDCDLCTAMHISILLQSANVRILPYEAQVKAIPRGTNAETEAEDEPSSVEDPGVCQSSTSAVCCALPHESSRSTPTPS